MTCLSFDPGANKAVETFVRFIWFEGFQQLTVGKERIVILVIITLHVLVLQKKSEKKNTSGQKLNNDLCVHACVTNIRGHNRGFVGEGIKGSQVSGGEEKKYHIDTYTHPVLLQRQPPTGSLPPIQYNSDKINDTWSKKTKQNKDQIIKI